MIRPSLLIHRMTNDDKSVTEIIDNGQLDWQTTGSRKREKKIV